MKINKTIRNTHTCTLALASIVTVAMLGCGKHEPGPICHGTSAVVSTNAIYSNALFGNALYGNAIYANAMYANALYSNGMFANAMFSNAMFGNALFANGSRNEALMIALFRLSGMITLGTPLKCSKAWI